MSIDLPGRGALDAGDGAAWPRQAPPSSTLARPAAPQPDQVREALVRRSRPSGPTRAVQWLLETVPGSGAGGVRPRITNTERERRLRAVAIAVATARATAAPPPGVRDRTPSLWRHVHHARRLATRAVHRTRARS